MATWPTPGNLTATPTRKSRERRRRSERSGSHILLYAGDPTNFPANVRLITDSDAPNGANFQAGGEDLADRTAWLQANAITSLGGDITNGNTLTIDVGAGLVIEGGAQVETGANFTWNSGSTLEIASGAVLQVDGGGAIEMQAAASMVVASTASVSLLGSGGLQGKVASAIQAQAAHAVDSLVQGGIRLSGGTFDYPTLNPPRPRILKQWLAVPSVLATGWLAATDTGFNMNQFLLGAGTTQPQDSPLLLTHNGATLASVTVYFKVAVHVTLPTNTPTLTVTSYNPVTGAFQVMGTANFGTPANVTAYHDGGAIQPLVCPCNPTYSVIDSADLLYYVTLVDENGGGAIANVNIFYDLSLSYTGITDMRFST